jgi:hypothetical protein
MTVPGGWVPGPWIYPDPATESTAYYWWRRVGADPIGNRNDFLAPSPAPSIQSAAVTSSMSTTTPQYAASVLTYLNIDDPTDFPPNGLASRSAAWNIVELHGSGFPGPMHPSGDPSGTVGYELLPSDDGEWIGLPTWHLGWAMGGFNGFYANGPNVQLCTVPLSGGTVAPSARLDPSTWTPVTTLIDPDPAMSVGFPSIDVTAVTAVTGPLDIAFALNLEDLAGTAQPIPTGWGGTYTDGNSIQHPAAQLAVQGVIQSITCSRMWRRPAYRWLYADPTPSGQWRLRQRQSLTGSDSWPLRQRHNGAHTGSWPLRQRQAGV